MVLRWSKADGVESNADGQWRRNVMPRAPAGRRRLSPENAQRVTDAAETLEFFGSLPGADPDEALTDFVCNLMHLCAYEGTDFTPS